MQKLPMDEASNRKLISCLRQVDFFKPFKVSDIEILLPHFELYGYKKGETVFKKGEPGDAFYIVHEGRVSVNMKDGFFSRNKQLAVLSPGNFFGEMALLDRRARSATVIAEEDTRLFVLLSVYFEDVVKQNPTFGEEIQKIALQRKFQSSH
jgi:CRP-like cAMP-binding protein